MAGNEFIKDSVNYLDGSGETGISDQSSRSYPRAEVTLMQFMMESAKIPYMKKRLNNGILEVRKFWNNSWKVSWSPFEEEVVVNLYIIFGHGVAGTTISDTLISFVGDDLLCKDGQDRILIPKISSVTNVNSYIFNASSNFKCVGIAYYASSPAGKLSVYSNGVITDYSLTFGPALWGTLLTKNGSSYALTDGLIVAFIDVSEKVIYVYDFYSASRVSFGFYQDSLNNVYAMAIEIPSVTDVSVRVIPVDATLGTDKFVITKSIYAWRNIYKLWTVDSNDYVYFMLYGVDITVHKYKYSTADLVSYAITEPAGVPTNHIPCLTYDRNHDLITAVVGNATLHVFRNTTEICSVDISAYTSSNYLLNMCCSMSSDVVVVVVNTPGGGILFKGAYAVIIKNGVNLLTDLIHSGFEGYATRCKVLSNGKIEVHVMPSDYVMRTYGSQLIRKVIYTYNAATNSYDKEVIDGSTTCIYESHTYYNTAFM